MRLSLLLTDINKSLSAWLMPVIGREREAKMINVTIDELTPCLKDVQGLVAIDPNSPKDALYVVWMVAAPHNNAEICGEENQKYYGTGGHLFAIAIMKSVEYGSGGAIFGFANDIGRLQHYEKWFQAEHIGILHEYHFLIADKAAVKVVEDYNYEWSEDEL